MVGRCFRVCMVVVLESVCLPEEFVAKKSPPIIFMAVPDTVPTTLAEALLTIICWLLGNKKKEDAVQTTVREGDPPLRKTLDAADSGTVAKLSKK